MLNSCTSAQKQADIDRKVLINDYPHKQYLPDMASIDLKYIH